MKSRMKEVNIEFNQDMDIVQRIDTMARWVIVNSIIYYEFNFNVVPDKTFDNVCKQLVFIISKFEEQAKNCYYCDIIKDFDGTTGFDLIGKLPIDHKGYLEDIAKMIMKSYKSSL